MPLTNSGAIAIVNLTDQQVTVAVNNAKAKDQVSIAASTPYQLIPHYTWNSDTESPSTKGVPNATQWQASMVAIYLVPSQEQNPGTFAAGVSNTFTLSGSDFATPVTLSIDLSTLSPTDSATIFIADGSTSSSSAQTWGITRAGVYLPTTAGS